MLTLLALGVMAVLVCGYLLYGSFIARQYSLDDARQTPASLRNDGVDFVPTRPFYLLGQHFSAIAAAGPIVGPIAACVAFGWGPSLLWIVIGVVFIGAVHDFSALVVSVRHGAVSIAQVAKENIGGRAWLVLSGFIYVALLYVIIAFTDVTAQTFRGLTEELLARPQTVNRGGAVALASVLYLGLALLMGVLQRVTRLPMLVYTLVFVPATLGVVYLGSQFPNVLNFSDARVWYVVIAAYCLIASLLPVWLLQQPRGYLGGWLLYLACGVGIIGIVFGGFDIQRPAFEPMRDYGAFFLGSPDAPPMTGLIFPFLFVTIACGACSGFHGLICGGTTSKQIAKESHCKAVGFGAMLLEGLVAVVALGTVMIVAKEATAGKAPGVLYGDGLATFIARFLDPAGVRDGTLGASPIFVVAATFGAMAFSTFVFDTLDVSVRLGRYLLGEITGWTGRWAGVAASCVTVAIPLALLLGPASAPAAPGAPPAWQQFWTLFGTSNQLLAALTLLGITVWLHRQGKRCWYVAAPMVVVGVITLSAIALQIFGGVRAVARGGLSMEPAVVNALVACVLLGLALVFIKDAAGRLRAASKAPEPR